MPRLVSLPGRFVLSWPVLLLSASVLSGAWLLLSFAEHLSLWQSVAGWSLLVAGAVWLTRRLLWLLAGPVLFHDAVRSARRGRHGILRCLYAAVLLVVLFALHARWFGDDLTTLASPDGEETVPARRVAAFASSVFYLFLVVQYLVVLILAPALTAGAIAGEKEGRTLEDLLTTDLSAREIIVGKLLSRVGGLLLLLLTGLPVLSLLQLLGGVDPSLLIAAFAGTLGMTISVASLGVLNSVHASRSRDAAFLTYSQIVAYHVVTGICCGAFISGSSAVSTGSPFTSSVGWAYGLATTGNLVGVFAQLNALADAGLLGTELPALLLQYALFHGVVTVGALTWAALHLRRCALLKEAPPPGSLAAIESDSLSMPLPLPRPLLGNMPPMLWKERFVEGRLPFPPALDITLSIMAGLWLFLAAMMLGCGVLAALQFQQWVLVGNAWTRFLGSVTVCVGIIGIALRAASTISSERERGTLDSLLTTDLTSAEILNAKWRASVESVPGTRDVLFGVVLLGVLMGGVCPFALPLLLAFCLVQAAFAASLGMYCSLVSRGTFRATVATLVILLGLTVGHWLIELCGVTLLHLLGHHEWARRLTHFHTWGLTPPMSFVALAFCTEDFGSGTWGKEGVERILAALAGMLFYAMLAALLWWRIVRRFGEIAGRKSGSRA